MRKEGRKDGKKKRIVLLLNNIFGVALVYYWCGTSLKNLKFYRKERENEEGRKEGKKKGRDRFDPFTFKIIFSVL